jgi:hypothetical protein
LKSGPIKLLFLLTLLMGGSTTSHPAAAKDGRKEPKMTQPPDDARDFTLTFRSDSDRIGPDLYAYMEVMRFDGRSGNAVMFLNRQGGDLRQPIGLFAMTLTPQQVAALGSSISAIKWNELPEATGGDISAAMLSIDYKHGTRLVQRSFNAQSMAFMKAIGPVITQVGDLGTAMEAHPARALSVSLARTAMGFKLVIRNIGTGPVMISDPRLSGGKGGGTRGTVGVVKVQKRDPNVFAYPAKLQPVALQPPPKDSTKDSATVVIAAGQAHEVETVDWTPPEPGEYRAGGAWQDYVGPTVDPKTIMPTLPDPQHGDDKRPYAIRGAAFADDISFTVDKPRR